MASKSEDNTQSCDEQMIFINMLSLQALLILESGARLKQVGEPTKVPELQEAIKI